MKTTNFIILLTTMMTMAFSDHPISKKRRIQLITLDPGHFHAALVQKTMYDDVDPVVHVYAPAGNDLQLHLDRINAYNSRQENPTNWKEEVYTGNDFFEKMIAEKKGNVVVLSGNNEKKTDYILKCLQNGFNVFGDKPMAIDSKGFEQLKQAFDIAQKNNLVLYDIMTERYEITTILQRELSMMPEIFGELQKGTADDPAVVKKSIHYFYKLVSGTVLTRPAWFFDEKQQGEGIVDVMTHLVDLVQWECFPSLSIDYKNDIQIDSAKHWATNISHDQFDELTNWSHPNSQYYPDYLNKHARKNASLDVLSNGQIDYTVKGIHARTTVVWDYKAPEGSGDNYYALMKGTKANLEIKQTAEEKFQPTLYIEPLNKNFDLFEAFKKIQAKYPGVGISKTAIGWQVIIPEKYKEGHEAHFARVTEKFLEYLKNKNMPGWEIPNMITKYFITTKALEIASKNKK